MFLTPLNSQLNDLKSYRDTFRLLLQYLQAKMAKKPSALSIADLDAPVILSFLESLEQQRHNQAQPRNVRLTAIRSFFRLVALRDPTSVGVATRVLAIPLKRIDHRLAHINIRATGRIHHITLFASAKPSRPQCDENCDRCARSVEVIRAPN